MGDPQNGWFIMENTIEMDDEQGTPMLGTPHTYHNHSHRHKHTQNQNHTVDSHRNT